ncbi:hypothetical protein COLO4_26399 [Corchorus olitorius]|uniref:Uncharacterized protein n=1 Tax=Corchorus olitorius TaxID=93759 RepID=A0A1R3HX88_9ROSI|nr:hypothetical protein COLO4_26399 [Corchorus olitorius]
MAVFNSYFKVRDQSNRAEVTVLWPRVPHYVKACKCVFVLVGNPNLA